MQFNLEHVDNGKILTDYGEGFIDVDRKRYHTGICLFGNTVIEEWDFADAKGLSLPDLQPALCDKPEILILGTGLRLVFPQISLIAELQNQGTVVETMSTSTACRTYNILASERRKVAAALMQIKP